MAQLPAGAGAWVCPGPDTVPDSAGAFKSSAGITEIVTARRDAAVAASQPWLLTPVIMIAASWTRSLDSYHVHQISLALETS